MEAHTTPELDSGFFDGEFSVKKVLELLGDTGNDDIGGGKGTRGSCGFLLHRARKRQSQNLLTSQNTEAIVRFPEQVSERNVDTTSNSGG